MPIGSYLKATRVLLKTMPANVSVFLMSDSEEALRDFRKEFGAQLVVHGSMHRTQSTSGRPAMFDPVLEARARSLIGEEALREVMAMTKTQAFIHHESALGRLAWLFGGAELRSFTLLNPLERLWIDQYGQDHFVSDQMVTVKSECVWQPTTLHLLVDDSPANCTGVELQRAPGGFCRPSQAHNIATSVANGRGTASDVEQVRIVRCC